MLKSTNADNTPEAMRTIIFLFDGTGKVGVGWEFVGSCGAGASIFQKGK